MGMCTFCCCSIILVALVFALGITGFVSWIITGFVRVFHLKCINYQVTDASLQFNLTNNNTTLEYNLAFNITLQTPNDKIGLHVERIDAGVIFMKQTLNNVSLSSSSSYLRHKKTVVLPALFKGQPPISLGADEVSNFKNVEDFDVLLHLDVKYWVKFLASKVKTKQSHIACSLKVPLNNGKSTENFKVTQCKAHSSNK